MADRNRWASHQNDNPAGPKLLKDPSRACPNLVPEQDTTNYQKVLFQRAAQGQQGPPVELLKFPNLCVQLAAAKNVLQTDLQDYFRGPTSRGDVLQGQEPVRQLFRDSNWAF